MRRLTKAQRRELQTLVETGFAELSCSFGKAQANGPRWKLVAQGFAKFGFGPEDSFLRVQGFFPTEAGRAALKAMEGQSDDQ